MKTMLTEAWLSFRKAQIVLTHFGQINFYFFIVVFLLLMHTLLKPHEKLDGVCGVWPPKSGEEQLVLSLHVAPFDRLEKNVDNLTITCDIGKNIMQHAYLIKNNLYLR